MLTQSVRGNGRRRLRMAVFVLLVVGLAAAVGRGERVHGQGTLLQYSVQQYSNGSWYTGIHLADLDYDGRLEILAGKRNTSSLEIWRYDPSSETFNLINSISFAWHIHDINAADFEADGDVDLLVGLRSYGLYFVKNNGPAGTIGNWSISHPDSRYSLQIIVQDFDGDGFLDVFHCVDGGPINPWYGNGAGGFTLGAPVLDPLTTMRMPRGFSAVDLNEDDFPDLVGVDGSFMRAFLNPGNRTSNWASIGPSTPDGDYPCCPSNFLMTDVSPAAGDLDGNGVVDQVANLQHRGTTGDVEVIVYEGSESAGILQWTPVTIDTISSPGWAGHSGVADLNMDGHGDVHVGGYDRFNGLYVYLGDGSGSYSPQFVDLDHGVGSMNSFAVGDINLDGKADIVAARWDGGHDGFEVLLNISNEPPTAVDDAYTTNEDTTLAVAAPGVLANDDDPDNDPLTAVLEQDAEHGDLTFNADGSFTYAPDPYYVGPDSFSYKAYDGNLYSDVAAVNLTVNQTRLHATVLDSAGSGLAGVKVYYNDYGNHWVLLGTSDGTQPIVPDLPAGTYKLKAVKDHTEQIIEDVTVPGDVTFQTAEFVVHVKDSGDNDFEGIAAHFNDYGNHWLSMGNTDVDGLARIELFPGTHTFKATKDHTSATDTTDDPAVAAEMQTAEFAVHVKNSAGSNFQDIAVAFNDYGNHWLSMGNTDVDGLARIELFPGTHTFKATKDHTSAAGATSDPAVVVELQTAKAIGLVRDCDSGALLAGFKVAFNDYGNHWLTVGTTGPDGTAAIELFPEDNRRMRATIDHTYEIDALDLAPAGTTVEFNPTRINFQYSGDVRFNDYGNHWKKMTSPFYLFPGTYDFKFDGVEQTLRISGCAMTFGPTPLSIAAPDDAWVQVAEAGSGTVVASGNVGWDDLYEPVLPIGLYDVTVKQTKDNLAAGYTTQLFHFAGSSLDLKRIITVDGPRSAGASIHLPDGTYVKGLDNIGWDGWQDFEVIPGLFQVQFQQGAATYTVNGVDVTSADQDVDGQCDLHVTVNKASGSDAHVYLPGTTAVVVETDNVGWDGWQLFELVKGSYDVLSGGVTAAGISCSGENQSVDFNALP